MEHLFLDKYSELKSIIHTLDPRIKLACCLCFIISVILIPPSGIAEFIFFIFFLLPVIFLSHIPFLHILKKSMFLLPYLTILLLALPYIQVNHINYSLQIFHFNHKFSSHDTRIIYFLQISLKSILSLIAIILLSATTRFSHLLKAMESFNLPKILILLLSFMYRYIFIFIDEVQHIQRSWRSRYFGAQYIRQIKTFAHIIGTLFIRTYERSERIYQNMLARGFSVKIKTYNSLKTTIFDYILLFTFLFFIIIVKIIC